MSRRGGGKLGDGKGGDLLLQIKNTLKAPEPTSLPSSSPPLPGQRGSADDQLGAEMLRRAATQPQRNGFASKTQHNIKSAGKKGKPKKNADNKTIEVIKLTREQKEQLKAISKVLPAEAVSTTPSCAVTYDFGEAAYKKLAPLRGDLNGFTADLRRTGGGIPPVDLDLLARRIQRGADAVPGIIDRDEGFFVGYDLGTSTTKVVVRDPYASLDDAFAIPVPTSFCSGSVPHLFPTALWLQPSTGTLSLAASEGGMLLDSFKAALIQDSGHRICNGSGVTMNEAACAFVALHLAYVIGAALEEEPSFKLSFLNVGVPVAVMDGRQCLKSFDRVVGAATRLVPFANSFTLADVRDALKDAGEPLLPFECHAELSGAVAGYCATPRHYLGGHMIIDCGSATLDMVTFDLAGRDSNRPIAIYAARVENQGADAFRSFCQKAVTPEECGQAARYQEHLVFSETGKRRTSLFRQEDGGYPYQIILIGGGVNSAIHSAFFDKLALAFHRDFHRPEVAGGLRYDHACDPGRLILADGLARAPVDLQRVAMPAPPPVTNWQDPLAPGPEQV